MSTYEEKTVKLLDTINSPEDLRALPQNKLPALAAEIRDFMIEAVSKCGGHLAPSLGACDLSIALHYCFHTPEDKIVWDVGHQAYAHKILTGRKEQFSTIRQYGGLSGFPRVSESPYDALSVGHASTSISAALGMATARDLKKEKSEVVAVIGDGSLSGGLALEGLNNVGSSNTNITVVLNDNKMSISRNVGALSRYLTRILTDRRFNKLRKDVWDMLGNMSDVGKRIRSVVSNIDEAVKHMVIPGKLFEDMGLNYLGPVDGHNIDDMIEVFKFTRNTEGPVLVHVITKKGKGYSFAENDATKFHGVGKFSVDTGLSDVSKSGPSYSSLFGSTLIEIAREREDVVAITAAMPDGTGLAQFRDTYPDRFFDVGIAEGHAVTFAAGLALGGYTPVVALYSSFLQRAYDQLIHDIALDNLHVVFGIDRAGLVGEDGPTHHGAFDISFLRAVPNATILAPSDENQLRSMLYTAIHELNGPVFIRYPRGTGPGREISPSPTPLHGLTPYVVREGKEIAVVAIGDWLQRGEQLCDRLKQNGIQATLVDAIAVKPLDKSFYQTLFDNYKTVVTLENNSISGGFGAALLELASESTTIPRFIRFGLPDHFVKHGKLDLLLQDLGLTVEDMTQKVLQAVKKK